MTSGAVRLVVSVAFIALGAWTRPSFVGPNDNLPLIWLLLVGLIAGAILNHWIAVLVIPATYVMLIAVSEALDAGNWSYILPWRWFDWSTGEDLTLILLPPLAVVGFIGWGGRQVLSRLSQDEAGGPL